MDAGNSGGGRGGWAREGTGSESFSFEAVKCLRYRGARVPSRCARGDDSSCAVELC